MASLLKGQALVYVFFHIVLQNSPFWLGAGYTRQPPQRHRFFVVAENLWLLAVCVKVVSCAGASMLAIESIHHVV